MNIFHLNDIKLKATLGVYAWEQQIEQPIQLAISYRLPEALPQPLTLEQSIDYSAVILRCRELVKDQHFDLIENLAATLATTIVDEFSLDWISLTVSKLYLLPGVGSVSFTVERTRNST
jgi:7,8-dihydroneopterin aldolase/epimerase/oxygenase